MQYSFCCQCMSVTVQLLFQYFSNVLNRSGSFVKCSNSMTSEGCARVKPARHHTSQQQAWKSEKRKDRRLISGNYLKQQGLSVLSEIYVLPAPKLFVKLMAPNFLRISSWTTRKTTPQAVLFVILKFGWDWNWKFVRQKDQLWRFRGNLHIPPRKE